MGVGWHYTFRAYYSVYDDVPKKCYILEQHIIDATHNTIFTIPAKGPANDGWKDGRTVEV
jgi:hypothetical protein